MGKSSLPTPPALEPGIYLHFKGGKYLVLGVEIDSESKNFFVGYFSLEQRKWLTRPYASNKYLPDYQRCGFTDQISRDGYQGPRFKKVDANPQELRDALALALPALFLDVLKTGQPRGLFEGQSKGPYQAGY